MIEKQGTFLGNIFIDIWNIDISFVDIDWQISLILSNKNCYVSYASVMEL